MAASAIAAATGHDQPIGPGGDVGEGELGARERRLLRNERLPQQIAGLVAFVLSIAPTDTIRPIRRPALGGFLPVRLQARIGRDRT
jgi:hypothetical protein